MKFKMDSVLHWFFYFLKHSLKHTSTNLIKTDRLTQNLVLSLVVWDRIVFYVQNNFKWWSKIVSYSYAGTNINNVDYCGTRNAYVYKVIIQVFTVCKWLKKIGQSYLDSSAPAPKDI